MSRFKSQNGFTLIELLVVISIIALLISILLPALERARDTARTVQCASQERQVQLGLLNYAYHNEGNLPFSFSTPPYQIWTGLIAAKGRYIPSAEIFWCPSHDTDPLVPASWSTDRYFAYLLEQPHSSGWAYTGYSAGRYGTMPSYNDAPKRHAVNIGAGELPASSLIALCEAYAPGQPFGSEPSQSGSRGGWYYQVVGNNGWKLFVHEDNANVSFLDGHVETHKAEALGWRQASLTWDPSFDFNTGPWFIDQFVK